MRGVFPLREPGSDLEDSWQPVWLMTGHVFYSISPEFLGVVAQHLHGEPTWPD